jgi:competence protein ComEC
MDKNDFVFFAAIFLFLVFFSVGFGVVFTLCVVFFVLLAFWFRSFMLSMVVFFVLIVRLFVWSEMQFKEIEAGKLGGIREFNLRVCAEPDLRLDLVNYILCDLEPRLFDDRYMLKVGLYPKYEYGDVLQFAAIAETPFETEEFSYADYLKIFRVNSVLKLKGKVEVLESNPTFLTYLYRFKMVLVSRVEAILPEPYASLGNGLLLGLRKGFTDEQTEKLKITGLTHIVAVSGYNVSLVILLVDRFLFFIPRNFKYFIMVLFIIIFAFVAGLSASVVRACIMGGLAVSVLQFGYSSNLLRSLLLTALIMILWNPAILFFDLGFQLSFFATMGVVFLSKSFKFTWVPDKFGLRESLVLTMAAQIATLPTMIYYFGSISLISPLANILVAPFLPILMLLSFFVIIFFNNSLLIAGLKLLLIPINALFFLIIELTSFSPKFLLNFEVKDNSVLVVVYVLVILFILYKHKSSD